jgi:endonuclease YncB( thermonuclease family)
VVRVEGQGRDQHQRLLGRLWVEDHDVNLQMVAEGWAWAFTGFAGDDDLEAAEAAARAARRGLWADPSPLAPSQWRATHSGHSAPARR